MKVSKLLASQNSPWLLLCLVLFVSACVPTPADNPSSTTDPAQTEAIETEATQPDNEPVTTETGAQLVEAADGVPIAFTDRGDGETALVFVHCWACSRDVWRHQLTAFEDDYRVVAIDLGGHGESGREREAWSIQGLAGDVEAVVEHLDLQRVVLIGHSMGGPVALASIPLLDAEVVGMIPVDTLHDVESRWPESAAQQLVDQFGNDYEATMRRMMPAMFPSSADGELVESIVQQALSADRDAAMQLLLDFPRLDLAAMMERADVPVRAINAKPYSETSMLTKVEVNQKYADYDVRLMDGVGHFLQLEAPDEFNDQLETTLSELLSAPSTNGN